MKKTMAGVVAALGVFAALAHALGLSGLIVNQPGLAYSTRYVFDLNAADVNTVSATAVFSSAAYTSATFGTGQVSTGSITIASNALLSTAAATDQITVTSTAGAWGDSIVIKKRELPGAYVFLQGRDWSYGATPTAAAASIAAALNTIPWLSANSVGAVVYATAPTGAFYNGITVTTNKSANLTIAAGTFTGGQDAPTVYVQGYGFQAGRDYAVGAAASNSATNLAAAINAKSGLSSWITASPSGAVVSLQSNLAGALYNFPLSTTNSSAVSVLHPSLIGGATPAWALGGKTIALPAHGFNLATQVLYSKNSALAVGGLTDQTTYYVIPVDANDIQLASSANNAVAGTAITLTSSSTLTTALTSTLAPLAWSAGSAGFDWETSNDNSTWTAIATSSVTYSNGGAGNMAWTFSQLSPRYLSLNVVGPTSGGMTLKVTANGTYVY